MNNRISFSSLPLKQVCFPLDPNEVPFFTSSFAKLQKQYHDPAKRCAKSPTPRLLPNQGVLQRDVTQQSLSPLLCCSLPVKEKKTAIKPQYRCSFHPYHYAQQVASKKKEPSPLFSNQTLPSFHGEAKIHQETLQGLFGELIFALLAKTPLLPQPELYFHVERTFTQLKDLLTHTSIEELKKVSRSLLEELFPPLSSRAQKILENTLYARAALLREHLILYVIDSPNLFKEEILESFLSHMNKLKQALLQTSSQQIKSLLQLSTFQSEMLIRSFPFPTHSPLYQITKAIWEEKRRWKAVFNEDAFFAIYRAFAQKHPWLISFHGQIQARSSIFIKHLWYTTSEESTYALFLLWHGRELSHLPFTKQMEILEKRSSQMLPLISFDESFAKRALVKHAEKNSK